MKSYLFWKKEKLTHIIVVNHISPVGAGLSVPSLNQPFDKLLLKKREDHLQFGNEKFLQLQLKAEISLPWTMQDCQ